MPVVIFVALSLTLVDTQAVFAAANSGDDKPIERAKWMVFDETRSTMFILNNDDTLSAYDAANNTFTLSRKSFPGVKNAYSILTSPDGAFIAFSSIAGYSNQIYIFELDDVINSQLPVSRAGYILPVPTEGKIISKFSPDGKTLIVSDGIGNILFLDTEKPRQEKMSIDGSAPVKMELDKYGRLLVLKEVSGDLDIIDIFGNKVLATISVGSNSKDVLFNEVTDKIYVSHAGFNDVYVIDAQTLTVVEKIKVGSDPVAMTYDKNTGDVFVANNSAGTISIIASDFSVRTIDFHSPAYYESSPMSLFYLNAEKKLFIINSSTAKLFVYDVVTDKIIKEEKTSFFPLAIFGSEKLETIFVRHINTDFIWQMDGRTLDVQRIPDVNDVNTLFFSKPQGIAVDSELNRIYVSNVGDNTITVIDGETQKPITKITVNGSPQTIGFLSTTKKLYSVSPVDETLAVVDTAQESYPVKIIPVGKQPRSMAINTTTGRIYVSSAADSSVTVIDGALDEVIATVSLPAGGFPLVLSANTELNKVYAVAYGSNYISVINTDINTVEKQITVGQNPIWVRYIPELNRIFVSVEGEKKIVIINPENNEIVQTINTDTSGKPYHIFFASKTKYVYINLRNSEKVIVLAQDKDASSFRIIREAVIPFLGETDARPYNMVAVNKKTSLSYFTSGNKNNVVITRNELDKEGVLDPVWYATINADGSVIYSDEAKEAVPVQEEKKISFVTLSNIIKLLVLGFVIAIIGIVISMRRRSLRNNISSSL